MRCYPKRLSFEEFLSFPDERLTKKLFWKKKMIKTFQISRNVSGKKFLKRTRTSLRHNALFYGQSFSGWGLVFLSESKLKISLKSKFLKDRKTFGNLMMQAFFRAPSPFCQLGGFFFQILIKKNNYFPFIIQNFSDQISIYSKRNWHHSV